MLQRVQSIWLLFATLSILSLFLFPYIQIPESDGLLKSIMVTGVYENVNNQTLQTQHFTIITVATVFLALIPLITIFLFKNRKQQINLCYLTVMAILGYSFWLVQSAKGIIGDFTLQTENYRIGVFLPSLAILFLVLAIKGIKRDEKLIRSVDRLR